MDTKVILIMAEKLVALYRVSTDKQGNSGLGLESQQHVVRKHVESVSGEIVHEFIEVISGRKTIRPQLEAATCGDSAAQTPFCLLYTSPSPRDRTRSRMPSSA